jgi:hypothetical protein
MTAMTNLVPSDPAITAGPKLPAAVSADGRRRTAKIVEHPAFRASRTRAALDLPFTVLRLPVVLLKARGGNADCDSTLPTAGRAA